MHLQPIDKFELNRMFNKKTCRTGLDLIRWQLIGSFKINNIHNRPSISFIYSTKTMHAYCHTTKRRLTLTLMFLQSGCRLSSSLNSCWSSFLLIEILSPNAQQNKTQHRPAQRMSHDCHSCTNHNILETWKEHVQITIYPKIKRGK